VCGWGCVCVCARARVVFIGIRIPIINIIFSAFAQLSSIIYRTSDKRLSSSLLATRTPSSSRRSTTCGSSLQFRLVSSLPVLSGYTVRRCWRPIEPPLAALPSRSLQAHPPRPTRPGSWYKSTESGSSPAPGAFAFFCSWKGRTFPPPAAARARTQRSSRAARI